MKVVADSHALVWFTQDSSQLSRGAGDALQEAEAGDGIVVSVATLIDLWYVTQSTQGVSVLDLSDLRGLVTRAHGVDLYPVDVDITDAYTAIGREALGDPWDRFIVATATVLGVPLVTRDGAIQRSGLVETIW